MTPGDWVKLALGLAAACGAIGLALLKVIAWFLRREVDRIVSSLDAIRAGQVDHGARLARLEAREVMLHRRVAKVEDQVPEHAGMRTDDAAYYEAELKKRGTG